MAQESPTEPEELKPVIDLAKARELLLLDAKESMPHAPDTEAQRLKAIAGLEAIIGHALADAPGQLPRQAPDEPGSVSARAFDYVAHASALSADKPVTSAYDNLKRVFDRCGDLNQAICVLDWMSGTGLPEGVPDKDINDASAAVQQFGVRLLADKNVSRWLDAAAQETLSPDDTRNLALMKKAWIEAIGLGEDRIKAFQIASDASHAAWKKEKTKADDGHPDAVDFNAWLPHLRTMLQALRERGAALAEAYGVKDPYEALMLNCNPGLKKETVDSVLGDLGRKLPELAQTIIARQKDGPQPLALPDIDEQDQMRVVRRVMHALGLDPAHSRADQATHPFSADIAWSDQRLTVRRGKRDVLSRLIGLIHETGHELYSKNLPREWKDQPMGNAQSMWVHESQSLFWEREVAFTRPFMDFLSEQIRAELGKVNEERQQKIYDLDNPALSGGNLFRHVMQVLPENPIRTEADDVTYPLHIIVRHQLGPKLVDGSLPPERLPEEWNKAYRDILHVEVKNDVQGCMQDPQMASGRFPAFPGYTFGRLGAAMLGKKIRGEMGDDFEKFIRDGNFAPIAAKLTEKIHSYGSRYDGVELMERATSMKFSAQPYLDELHERYGIPELRQENEARDWGALANAQGRPGASGSTQSWAERKAGGDQRTVG